MCSKWKWFFGDIFEDCWYVLIQVYINKLIFKNITKNFLLCHGGIRGHEMKHTVPETFPGFWNINFLIFSVATSAQ